MSTEKLKQLAASDPVLALLIDQLPPPLFESTANVFHDLMSCVLEQQIHYRSTKKIFHKMLEAAQIERLTPANFHLLERAVLAHAKLSQAKYETIARVLEFWEKTHVNWQELSDKEVILKLASIKGIGSWTIDMILLYTLRRPNIFPVDDFHLKQIMITQYQLEPKSKLKAQLLSIAERWGEQKSLAVLYLLAAKRFQKARK